MTPTRMSQTNLNRAVIPLFLPPTRFIRSSMAPSTPAAISTATGNSMERRPVVLNTSVTNTTEAVIIRPPMVGVPVLPTWIVSSSRTFLPNFR